ncbi:hypothetical protein [Okeania sp.]|uniref:hypothetical protein n=1 Tax=Okeania sp. TaxID=3100323 RepID=UPI002B4B7BB3|nr:hypothetical protein [Okeania sp.]MEB3341491.1 hypothetical protein [Okeania sp.]
MKEYLASNLPELKDAPEEIKPSELEDLEKQVEELKKNEDQLVVKLEDCQEKNNSLEKKVEELKNENQNPTNSVESENNVEDSSTKKDSSLKRFYEINGFVFELQSCKKTNVNVDSQSINCELLITSTEKNAQLRLYASSNDVRSRIIEAGEIYLATKAQIGTSRSRSYASENLIKDVSLKASITFDKVSLEVNKIEVMQIFFWSNNKIPLEFDDVPVSE